MDTYYIKYLKYKNKYLTLQKQIGGIDCINKNKIDCKPTRGCNYNDKINKCVPDCEKFNNEKKYSFKKSRMNCNKVDECKFDDFKCIIRDDNLRKEHSQNS